MAGNEQLLSALPEATAVLGVGVGMGLWAKENPCSQGCPSAQPHTIIPDPVWGFFALELMCWGQAVVGYHLGYPLFYLCVSDLLFPHLQNEWLRRKVESCSFTSLSSADKW